MKTPAPPTIHSHVEQYLIHLAELTDTGVITEEECEQRSLDYRAMVYGPIQTNIPVARAVCIHVHDNYFVQ